MSHYFKNDDALPSEEFIVTYTLGGENFTLTSDRGVFSKNKIDAGSAALLKVIYEQGIDGKVIDLGAGIGVIGITLKVLFPNIQVTMLEINKRALNLAKRNWDAYKLATSDIRLSDVYSAINKGETFDAIIVNPPIRAGKQIVYKMLGESHEHLNLGGALYFVMRKSHGAKSAKTYVESVFGNCDLLKRHKGYYIYSAKKTN